MKQSPDPDGPHHLPYGEQERCAVEGRRIDGSGACTVIAIRDRKEHGWVHRRLVMTICGSGMREGRHDRR
ncbi:MAG: hypothetical protein ACRDTF_04545 [Pseudonocardiaceae bacterium]